MKLFVCLVLLGLSGCNTGAAGEDLVVLLEAEDTITEGIAAGSGEEEITDGWEASFDDYIVAIGQVRVQRSDDADRVGGDPSIFLVDLTDVPASGLALWEVSGLEAGRWEIFYEIPHPGADAMRDPSVSEADAEAMRSAGWTYLIRGTLSQPGGRSCPPASLATPGGAVTNGETNADGDPCYAADSVTFEIAAPAATTFGPCEVDEVPGFSIPEGGGQTVALTIHGDHIFFNGFPESLESGVTRLGQWWADADLDLDGAVSEEELRAVGPSDLAEIDDRYQLGGSPIAPLESMWDYVRAQLRTQGHFQGEGECPIGG